MFAARKTDNVSSAANYIEDVFSTYLYTGNGSTQTINNGIDLAGKGGLVWTKNRSPGGDHILVDTARGVNKYLISNTTAAQDSAGPLSVLPTFTSTGYTVSDYNNVNTQSYVGWTFRKQAKFFDVVTYTGNGVSTRDISHSLGSVPGCIIIKRTDASDDWRVYHRGWGFPGEGGALNLTAGFSSTYKALENVDPTATTFRPATPQTNTNGATYVAYLFAHDAGGFGPAGTDNVITCGSFTTNGSGNATVTLGYEPQFVMFKSSSNTGNWAMVDTMRGMSVNPSESNKEFLYANLSNAASVGSGIGVTSTGFNMAWFANQTFIYIAIRRGPMRPPTTGTNVFTPVLATSSGNMTFVAGFPVDMWFHKDKSSTTGWRWWDRLRDDYYLDSATTGAENSFTAYFDSMTQSSINAAGNYSSVIGYPMRRAPGFFDVVCYTGTGSATTFNHNLTVVPELMIVKRRDSAGGWIVYFSGWGDGRRLVLQSSSALISADSSIWNNTEPTSTQFTVGTSLSTGSATYVNYLFASVTGVSKVGSYTGNGSSQTINCGFTAGARFILIKRTDSTGDWYVYDTARGIVSGNDPQLKLNDTAAEATGYDAIDPDNSGFIVNNDATNFPINVNNATYIYLAIA